MKVSSSPTRTERQLEGATQEERERYFKLAALEKEARDQRMAIVRDVVRRSIDRKSGDDDNQETARA